MSPHAAGSLDAIVVGAGISGLFAARKLSLAGLRVRVIEARDRVGGRTLSQPLANDVIDLGGQWIGPKQERIQRLAKELGVRTFPQFTRGKKVVEIEGVKSSYRGLVPRLPILSQLEVGRAMAKIEYWCRKVPLDSPWDARRAAAWDGMAVETFKQQQLRTAPARAAFDFAVRSVFAVEPSELSFLYFLFYLRSGHGLLQLLSAEGGAQQDRFVGGAQQISLKLASELRDRGVELLLEQPVSKVVQRDDRVIVHTGARVHAARFAVFAIPPALAADVTFEPPLPQARERLQQSMPMGSVIKCVAAYAQPFWRHQGFSGEAVSDGDPVRLVFDDSAHDGSSAALVAFVLGDAAKRWTGRPKDELRGAVLSDLARLLGPEAQTPVAFVSQDWPAERWSRGCYVGVMGPNTMTQLGASLREPCGRVHWAGTETAREGCGYFEGAVEAGDRAAAEVMRRGASR